MSTIDTDEFRKLLEDERARLQKNVQSLRDDDTTMEDELGDVGSAGVDNHLGDQASVMTDRELDAGLAEGAEETLAEIEAAFVRIEDGTYGMCEYGDKEIGEDRLRVVPWTRYCIDHAKQQA